MNRGDEEMTPTSDASAAFPSRSEVVGCGGLMECPFVDLPAELNDFIFSFLTVNELAKVCRVSRSWRWFSMGMPTWNTTFVRLLPASDVLPPPRVCHAAMFHKGQLWVVSGDQGNPYVGTIQHIQNNMWRFDFATRLWTPVPTLELPCTEVSVVQYNGFGYIFGGNSSSVFSNTIWQLDFETVKLTPITPASATLPPPRSAHCAVLYKSRMYVFGGWNASTTYDDFWEFDFETLLWRQIIAPGSPRKCRTQKAVVFKDYMYIMGGWDSQTPPEEFNKMYRFDFNTSSWEQVITQGPLPTGRGRLALVQHPTRPVIYMFGGWNRKDHYGELNALDLNTNTWSVLDSNLSVITGGLAQCACNTISWLDKQFLLVSFGYWRKEDRATSNLLLLKF
ncbi:Kelch-type beta propeller [Pelomyxa schiedti]|nr:Kelch-type beta propeller [Pelomyxa schiedti]